jgi:hypothetical protein
MLAEGVSRSNKINVQLFLKQRPGMLVSGIHQLIAIADFLRSKPHGFPGITVDTLIEKCRSMAGECGMSILEMTILERVLAQRLVSKHEPGEGTAVKELLSDGPALFMKALSACVVSNAAAGAQRDVTAEHTPKINAEKILRDILPLVAFSDTSK